MNTIQKFLDQHWFVVASGCIVLVAAFLRFFDYFNRWGLAYDQAHDMVIAQYAITTNQLPLLGPFSSAGPFQTGGEWYWFIMLGRLFIPFAIQGPWILLTTSQVIFVGLMLYVGYRVGGRILGIITGLLAAFSPVGIAQSINLTNQSLLNICAALLIISTLWYFQTRKHRYLFSMGIFTTLGATLHFQGLPLIFFSLIALLLGKVTSKKGLLLFFIGAVLPVVPLLYSDYLHHWINIKNMLQYYLHDQYRIPLQALGRRWITYLGYLWPTLWGNVVSGNLYIGYGFIIASLFLFGKALVQRKISVFWVILVVPFLAIIFLLKNVRTPIFDSYIMFLHPFILLISASVLSFFLRMNKYIGMLLVCLVICVALQKDAIDIANATNWSALRAQEWTKMLIKKYPHEKFAMYDYNFRSTTESMPLIMYLQYNNLVDNNGYKIGFGLPGIKESIHANDYVRLEIKENTYGFNLIDLNSSSSAQLAKENWVPLNPSYRYDSQEYSSQ